MSLRELHKGLAALSPEQRALFARRLAESGWGTQAPEILPRSTGEAPVAASLVQQRLWLLDQMEPGNPFYNLPLLCFRLTGELRPGPLERCFQEIERRHESLRTVFADQDGVPFQVIQPHVPRPIPRVDLSALPADRGEEAAWELAREEARRLFDLARGPLWRTHLLRLGGRVHLLLVTMHHIISDAWSLGVFYRELSVLYTAFAQGLPSPLPEPFVQYPDFALWQRERLQGERLEEELRFWKGQLAGAPDRLELPTDRPRPAARAYGGERVTLDLPAGLPDALAGHTHLAGASLYMVLLAGFDALLHRWSGQDDVVLGAPVAGRTNMETEGLIGFFVNTVVFRVRLDGDPTFGELLARVRDVVLDVYEHQELPFDKLVEELRPRRDPSYGPIFQAMFSLQNTPSPDLALPGLAVEPRGINNGTSQTDLILFAGMERGRLGILQLELNTSLFEAPTIERMGRHLTTLLAAAVAEPGRRISELPMLAAAEREQLRAWGNADAAGTDGLPVAPLPRRFEAQAARTPDVVAVIHQGHGLTYRELDRKANALAHRLRALGVGPEVRVALCVHRGLEMLVALLGVLKAGGAYVPLDPAYPPERLVAMLEGAPVLLVESALAQSIPPGDARLVILETGDEAERAPETGLLPDHPAYVIHTSGSTGRPKGVVVTHANVARLFAAARSRFGFGPGDVWTLFHSYAFDFSVWEIWGALLHGGRLVVPPSETVRSPRDFHRLLAEEGVTVLNQTPSAFRQLSLVDAEAGAPRLLALRWVIFGGEALDPRSLGPWIERHGDRQPRLVNMYGITETTVHVTWRPVERADAASSRSRIGPPLPDLSLRLLGPRGEEVPIGVPGEIHVGGAGLARGYLQRPELTAERFVPDPFGGEPGARLYRAGDLARRLPDGDLEFLGRVDRQVKVRGFRIELGEIESALGRHPAVRECAAAVREIAPGEPGIAAWWVPVDTASAGTDAAELRAFLRRSLPEHMLPAAFQPLPALPLTPSGKLDRRALPAPERQGSAAFSTPATPVEQALAELWRDLLGVERVGREDDFFELGGHSLLATRLASRLRDRFRRDLSAQVVFHAPTLAAMARAVEAAADAAPEPGLAALPRRVRRTV